MLKIEVNDKSDKTEVSVGFNGTMPALMASLVIGVKAIREDLKGADRDFFDFALSNFFAPAVTFDMDKREYDDADSFIREFMKGFESK